MHPNGLPRRVLCLSTSLRPEAAVKGGPDGLAWAWLHPGMLPRVLCSRGAARAERPLPMAFCHGGSRELNFSFCFGFFLFLIHIEFLADD